MKIRNTITQPEKIIPEHLQHNAKEWHRHHMAGKEKKHVNIQGVGNGLIEPKINIPEIYCEICGKSFRNKKSMTDHRRWHKIDRYKEFQKIASRKSSVLLKKYYKKHPERYTETLAKGKKKLDTKNKRSLRIHISRWINIEKNKPKICDICKKRKPYGWYSISRLYKKSLDDYICLCRSCITRLQKKREKYSQPDLTIA